MASAVIGALRVVLGMNAGEFDRSTQRAAKGLDKIAARAQALGTALGTAFAVHKITGFINQSITAFGKQDRAIKAVEATLRTTGGAAGYTSGQLQKMAADLQEVSTYGDEEILQKVTNNLLTFGNITGDVFKEAQKQALNLSALFGKDLQDSAIMLGKALNDPVANLGALSKNGIQFTEQQKKQIQTLLETNQAWKAQGIILAEIQKYYGEAASAVAKSVQGQLTQAANTFGDAMEKIGASVAPIVVTVANGIKFLAEKFQALSPEMQRGIVVGGAVAAALAGVVAVVGSLAFVLGTAIGPIAAVIAGLSTLAGFIVTNWRGITNLVRSIAESFQQVYEGAKKWLVDAFEPIVRRVQQIMNAISSAYNSLKETLGFDTVAATMSMEIGKAAAVVQGGVDHIKEIWNRGAEEAAATASETALKAAQPFIQTANQIKMAEAAATEAARKIRQEQEALVQRGVSLVEEMRTPQEILAEKAKALDMALAKNKISAAQFGDAMQRATWASANAYAAMGASIANNLATAFGNSKAFAIAAAIINTAEAITKTIATYGMTPWGIAAAAAAAAAGAAQIAAIQRTNKGGGGGGGAATSAAVASSGTSGGGQAATPQQQQAVHINMHGEFFSREMVMNLIDQMNEAQRDGSMILVGAAA